MSDLDVLRELTGRLQPPAYDDLVAVSRKRRRRSLTSGAAAVAAAVVVVTIAVIGSNGGGARPQPAPVPQPPTSTPRPEPTRTSSSETWVDTDVASAAGGLGWAVPDPLQSTREGWFSVLSDHFDPNGERFTPDGYGGFIVEIPGPGGFVEYGNAGVLFDRGDGRTLAEGCQHFVSGLPGEPCSRKRLAGPHGERAWVYQRPCCGYIDVSPTPMSDDYGATVAVERDDGTIGYVEEHWRGGPDANPYDLDDLAAAAVDPRLTLPDEAFVVPRSSTVTTVVLDHLPRYRADAQWADALGVGTATGQLDDRRLSVTVTPAGGAPRCGRLAVRSCVERRVFGADDPTTVYVGHWDISEPPYPPEWELVHVGPLHTVVVKATRTSLGTHLQETLIDILLDPRLQ